MGAQRRKTKRDVVSAARKRSADRLPEPVGLVIVLALAVVVVVMAVVTARDRSSQTAQPIPAVTSPPDSVPGTLDRQGGTVVTGQPDTPVVIDVYEDFLCPAYGRFEARYGHEIHHCRSDGTLQVRYHLVHLLDRRSDPPGFSLAAYEPQAFLGFHTTLMRHMAPEHTRPHGDDQLIDLARRLGVTADAFAETVREAVLADAVRRQLEAAPTDPALRRTSRHPRWPSTGASSASPPTPGWLANLPSSSPGQPFRRSRLPVRRYRESQAQETTSARRIGGRDGSFQHPWCGSDENARASAGRG